VVPDVVTNAPETLALWGIFSPALKQLTDCSLALAVQDQMSVADVLSLEIQPDVVFVGGTHQFKVATLVDWCRSFRRVHVGGINSLKMLWECDLNGVESIDGSGWFRVDPKQVERLVSYLDASLHGKRPATLFDKHAINEGKNGK
jgi:hypothetical protein